MTVNSSSPDPSGSPDPHEMPCGADYADKRGAFTGLAGDVCQLASDARTVLEAELAYQSSRARVIASAGRMVALYGIAAFVLIVFALVALVVGLLLALTPLVTAWGATAIVAGVLVLLAYCSSRMALKRWRSARAALAGDKGE